MRRYIIDLDGTMFIGNDPLPYADKFISRLNKIRVPYAFYTNSPELDPRSIERRLRSLRIPAPRGSVITSGTLAVDYLRRQISGTRGRRAHVLGSRYVRALAARNGLILVRRRPDYVLVSYAETVTMADVDRACSSISSGARFIATNPDDVVPRFGGLRPHTGAIVSAITRATGVEPVIIGKPSGYAAEFFTELFGCGADSCVVVGDRVDTDMKFARACGFGSCLVLTGLTSREEAERLRPEFDACFVDLEELSRTHFVEGA